MTKRNESRGVHPQVLEGSTPHCMITEEDGIPDALALSATLGENEGGFFQSTEASELWS